MNIDIRITQTPIGWFAYDDLTYDADCDGGGYFSLSPTGQGKTPYEAARELIERMEEEAA